MCVLHNLSYRLDAEVPTRYRQLEYTARNAYTDKSSTGCFSNKSDRMTVSARGPHSPRGPVHPPARGARDRPWGRGPAPPGPRCTRSGERLISPTTQALRARGDGAGAACGQASSPLSSPSFLMVGVSLAPTV